ncbi:trypco2 family protein [Nostoc sp. FACHB-190]|uniref:trypco2 family protein n=1 Tax=Nostoc sp. FACHB-190 TaxID=2692838 RepID=UPI001688AC4F|nr:trypco2 family protein [Nostoc sp. FACHB-190]MBD2303030.1 hypothetical protein [Nostoc sp. FACHB-190]
MPQTNDGIGLSELIDKVKQELSKTNKDNPVFLVENVELELQVSVSKEIEIKGQGEAKAELKINVLGADFLKLGEAKGSAEATRKVNQENIHTIRINLTPAILNDNLMNNLPDNIAKKVKDNPLPLLQGDDEPI